MFSFVLVFFLCFFVFYPLIFYAISGVTANSKLASSIANQIPGSATALTALDYFITAWDVNNRTPRYFTKWTNTNFQE